MKIVIEKSTGRVIFMFSDTEYVELTESGMSTSEFDAPFINSITHELAQAEYPQSPLIFVEGALSYTGEWAIYDQESYDSLKDRKLAKLAGIKGLIWKQIKAIRDTKTQEGGYSTQSKWFHSDTFSRTQQIGLVVMGANIPTGLRWKTMDGTFIDMTQTLANQVFAAAAAQDFALFAYAETLKGQVDSSNNPASIDITAGWPETYQGP